MASGWNRRHASIRSTPAAATFRPKTAAHLLKYYSSEHLPGANRTLTMLPHQQAHREVGAALRSHEDGAGAGEQEPPVAPARPPAAPPAAVTVAAPVPGASASALGGGGGGGGGTAVGGAAAAQPPAQAFPPNLALVPPLLHSGVGALAQAQMARAAAIAAAAAAGSGPGARGGGGGAGAGAGAAAGAAAAVGGNEVKWGSHRCSSCGHLKGGAWASFHTNALKGRKRKRKRKRKGVGQGPGEAGQGEREEGKGGGGDDEEDDDDEEGDAAEVQKCTVDLNGISIPKRAPAGKRYMGKCYHPNCMVCPQHQCQDEGCELCRKRK